MPPLPVPIQLALQGGGAKIICLIAALSAIKKLEEEGEIRVTRIAGTSAGAIAGALYAARVSMDDVRAWLSNESRLSLLTKLKIPWVVYKYYKILRGKPLIDPLHLHGVLKELFNINKVDIDRVRIEDFSVKKNRIPFVSFYTDLENNTVVQHHSTTMLSSALIESAALPFVLRTFKTNPRDRVDGGIGENLPTNMEPGNADGSLIAIAFLQSSNKFDGLINYSLSLLFTAIDYSVYRAKARLGEDNVCELKTKIGTLDFDEILGKHPVEEFDEAYNKTDQFFRKYALDERRRMLLDGDKWMECRNKKSVLGKAYRAFMENLGNIYMAQHGNNRPSVESLSQVITFHPDNLVTIKHIRKFSIGQSPLYATKIGISVPRNAELETYKINMYAVRHDGLERIAFRQTPVLDANEDDDDEISRPLVIWPLAQGKQLNGSLILEWTAKGKFMFPDLLNGEPEEVIFVTKNFQQTVNNAQIIIMDEESRLNGLNLYTLKEAFNLDYKFKNPDVYIAGSPNNFITSGTQRRVAPEDASEEALRLRIDKPPMGYGMQVWEAVNISVPETIGIVFRKEKSNG